MTEMVGNVGVILVNQLHAYPNVDAIAHAAHGIRLAAILGTHSHSHAHSHSSSAVIPHHQLLRDVQLKATLGLRLVATAKDHHAGIAK